jgi:heterodisulfide reductase subunit A-like polyferredoxin
LLFHYQDEDGRRITESYDMVVLSVGMEISASVRDLGRRLGIELDEYGFCHTTKFNPVETSRPGIYAVGPFREPKDIPESVIEASGAAAASAGLLAKARWNLTSELEYPPEINVAGQEPRIGVFVCHCGSNIGGFLDVPAVAEYARTLPGVVHAEDNLYTCSQDAIQIITNRVREHGLNRVVVASCSPLTHSPLFQDSIRAAGLNPFLFEMANIRNQCSWVHSGEWKVATTKAEDLVRMAVARAALLEPQHTVEVPVEKAALVVGGGVAGMTAALSLAKQGFPVHLVEKEADLGGNLRHVFTSGNGKDPQRVLFRLIEEVEANEHIALHLQSQVTGAQGFMGNFETTVRQADGQNREIRHGVTILATGAQEYRGPEYGYGVDPRIVTQLEFESLLARPDLKINDLKSLVMIQCVGPAERFCSRICCTVALKNALALKKLNPEAQIVILYRDIRTYGFKERLYTEAREQGVLFVRYDDEHRPQVGVDQDRDLSIETWDPILQRKLILRPDLLVLSMPVIPGDGVGKLATLFKVPVDNDGFFLEAHVKLRPVDFSTDGVFMAGMAHYPKLLDETMIQAQAAAARAARVLSRETLTAGGQVAVVDETRCTGCLTCVRICPFNVPVMKPNLAGVGDIMGSAYIEAAVCQGCGTCVAECPARAIQLMHYTDAQMRATVSALVEPATAFISLEEIVEI